MKNRRLWRVAMAVVGLTTVLSGPSHADDYVAGTTFVVRGPTGTVLDLGFVECNDMPAPSVGGACIPWAGGGSAVSVVDDVAGTDVPFQACVDNDGNGLCGGTPFIPGCEDYEVFSHFDDGTFSNPLAAPTSFRSGCPGGFPGWVVFLCQGTHATSTPHAHQSTAGTITRASSGGPSGQFCGGSPGKPYIKQRVPNGCFGVGTLHTPPLYVPLVGPTGGGGGFALTLSGACFQGGSVSGNGTITGNCSAASGTGSFGSHRFSFQLAGAAMELVPVGTNGATGTLGVNADPTAGQSCFTGATQFLVAGSVTLL